MVYWMPTIIVTAAGNKATIGYLTADVARSLAS